MGIRKQESGANEFTRASPFALGRPGAIESRTLQGVP